MPRLQENHCRPVSDSSTLSTPDAGGMSEMTKDIVSLMETTENIVGMIEMAKGTGTALRRGQESRRAWTDTGIVLSLSIAGIQEADCLQSTTARNVVSRSRRQV